MQLFKELQRRNVFRVTIGYIVSSWLLVQVADLVTENIGSPDWVMQTIMLVLALGFPVVVFFSWAYEVTPEGLKRESEVDRSESVTHLTARKLDRAITLTLVIALAYFAYDKFFQADTDQTAVEQNAAETDQSIAVLPFVNMSDDASNEYFSEGLSEELLNLLAKNPGLRVAARTSSFSFKGQQREISDIAERLNVTHVLEGSVRRDGNQVRITAQLIKAADGYHLWSETYDRTLDNIFAVQDEIAGEIAAALLPQILSDNAAASAAIGGTTYDYAPPADVYQQYLLARSFFNKQSTGSYTRAIEILTPLVRENPGYAEAQALYAHVMFSASARTGGDIPWIIAEAQVHKGIQQALSLNPDLPEAYLVEGRLHERSRDPKAAIQSFEKAIALNPSYSDAYVYLGQAAMSARLESKVWDALETAKQLDPVSTSLLTIIVEAATTFDRPEAADEALDLLQQLQPEAGSELRARSYMRTNEIARAAIQLEKHIENYPGPGSNEFILAYLYAYMGMAEEAGDLSPRMRLLIAAQQGRKDIVMPLMEELAAKETDPHDRADVYWMSYVSLGMYDEALAVLADLWYGYAEEQMGPRMDGKDIYWFAVLLQQAGREDELTPIIKVLRDSAVARGITNHLGLLYLDGKLDELLVLLNDRADKGDFEIEGIRMYLDYLGIEKHPDYAALAARAAAWREKQFELYQSLKIADE